LKRIDELACFFIYRTKTMFEKVDSGGAGVGTIFSPLWEKNLDFEHFRRGSHHDE